MDAGAKEDSDGGLMADEPGVSDEEDSVVVDARWGEGDPLEVGLADAEVGTIGGER